MSWTALIAILVTLPLAAIALAAWYAMAVPGPAHKGPLPPATAEERDAAARLRTHVAAIASTPHNVRHYAALEAAAAYVERAFESLGYAIDRQVFEVDGRSVRNIEAAQEPIHGGATVGTLVIGAHYDSFEDAPGANDNGTGTAAVLELARSLQGWRPQSTRLRFVLFVNEEPPYFRTRDMGSWRYAKMLSERGERVRGMLSLETIGFFSDTPGSQRYPVPFQSRLSDHGRLHSLRRPAGLARLPARGDRLVPQRHGLPLDRRGCT